MNEISVNGPNWSVQLSRNSSGKFDIALVLDGHHFDLPEMEALKIGAALTSAADTNGRLAFSEAASEGRVSELFAELGLIDDPPRGVDPFAWSQMPEVIRAAVEAHYVSSYCMHAWMESDVDLHGACRKWCKFGDKVERCLCPCHEAAT